MIFLSYLSKRGGISIAIVASLIVAIAGFITFYGLKESASTKLAGATNTVSTPMEKKNYIVTYKKEVRPEVKSNIDTVSLQDLNSKVAVSNEYPIFEKVKEGSEIVESDGLIIDTNSAKLEEARALTMSEIEAEEDANSINLSDTLALPIEALEASTKSVSEINDFVEIPDEYGTYETFELCYRDPNSNTHGWQTWGKGEHFVKSQGGLRQNAIEAGLLKRSDIFGLENCSVINDRLMIATTPNIGGQLLVTIGDYLDVEFEDGSVWNCILGDVKSLNDPGSTVWGHSEGKATVEIIYWDYDYNSGNQFKKVSRITKVGSYEYVDPSN